MGIRIFSLSDLHLSFGTNKPMDLFGKEWADHGKKIEWSWKARVSEEDRVIICGDTSWAMDLDEVLPDLEFLDSLPGKKILLKGNHCYWWNSRAKVERILPSSVRIIQNDAVSLGRGIVLAGTRGWQVSDDPADMKVLNRERERLKLSLEKARGMSPSMLIVATHFPPLTRDGKVSPLVEPMERAGASICLYGHIHGKDIPLGFQGTRNGVRYILTSCDALDFTPLKVFDTDWN